jgi:hypothetical protein
MKLFFGGFDDSKNYKPSVFPSHLVNCQRDAIVKAQAIANAIQFLFACQPTSPVASSEMV